MTRAYGNTGASGIVQALSVPAVVVRGTVRQQRVLDGVRVYDVAVDNGLEVFVACEALGGLDSTPANGKRVLVVVLPDASGVIIGALPERDAQLVDTAVAESDPDVKRANKYGSGDRVLTFAGSRVIFTQDGDIVIKPKRAFRVQASLTRLETGGDATDSPVALQAFLSWASQVDTTLAAHEADLLAHFALFNLHTGVLPVLAPPVPHVVTPLPVNTGEGMAATSVKIPAGSGQGVP